MSIFERDGIVRKKVNKVLVYVFIGIGLFSSIGFAAFAFTAGGALPASRGVTVEQTEKNIVIYENQLKEIATINGYDFSVLEREKPTLLSDDKVVEKIFVMQLNATSEVEILISNASYESMECYSIVYTNQLLAVEEASQNFDLQLLRAIEEVVAHKPFSIKKIKKFLAAPEKKYASSHYDFKKTEKMLIYKVKFKNLNEGAFYQLFVPENNSWKECLEYYGNTKNLK